MNYLVVDFATCHCMDSENLGKNMPKDVKNNFSYEKQNIQSHVRVYGMPRM